MKAIRGDRSQPTPALVFVYGSLLQNDQESHHLLEDHSDSECLGPASTLGSLYDLGDYPGLVKSVGTVYGELYRLSEDRAVSALDEWEAFHGYHRAGYDSPGYHGGWLQTRGLDVPPCDQRGSQWWSPPMGVALSVRRRCSTRDENRFWQLARCGPDRPQSDVSRWGIARDDGSPRYRRRWFCRCRDRVSRLRGLEAGSSAY